MFSRYSRTVLVPLSLAGIMLLAPQLAVADQTVPTVASERAQDDPRGIHRAIRWAETELAEMDATITALEIDAARLRGEARTRADAELAKLRATRDSYREKLAEAVTSANEKTEGEVERLNNQLTTDWAAFETQVEDYLSAAGADFEARKTVFEARAEAQRAAFEARIAELNRSAANATDEAKAAIEKRVAALDADLRKGRDQLARLGEASGAAWSQFVEGLREARTAFRETYEIN